MCSKIHANLDTFGKSHMEGILNKNRAELSDPHIPGTSVERFHLISGTLHWFRLFKFPVLGNALALILTFSHIKRFMTEIIRLPVRIKATGSLWSSQISPRTHLSVLPTRLCRGTHSCLRGAELQSTNYTLCTFVFRGKSQFIFCKGWGDPGWRTVLVHVGIGKRDIGKIAPKVHNTKGNRMEDKEAITVRPQLVQHEEIQAKGCIAEIFRTLVYAGLMFEK